MKQTYEVDRYPDSHGSLIAALVIGAVLVACGLAGYFLFG